MSNIMASLPELVSSTSMQSPVSRLHESVTLSSFADGDESELCDEDFLEELCDNGVEITRFGPTWLESESLADLSALSSSSSSSSWILLLGTGLVFSMDEI